MAGLGTGVTASRRKPSQSFLHQSIAVLLLHNKHVQGFLDRFDNGGLVVGINDHR